MILEVDIFDPEPKTFHESKSAAVHNLDHDLVWSDEIGDDSPGFVSGKNGGYAFASFGSDEAEESFIELDVEEVTVKEEDGADGLILGGG